MNKNTKKVTTEDWKENIKQTVLSAWKNDAIMYQQSVCNADTKMNKLSKGVKK